MLVIHKELRHTNLLGIGVALANSFGKQRCFCTLGAHLWQGCRVMGAPCGHDGPTSTTGCASTQSQVSSLESFSWAMRW